MSIDNNSFEDAATSPAPAGRPADWTVGESSTAVEFAAFSVFGASPDEGYPRETYEIGWPDENQTLIELLDDDNSEFASFDIGPGQQQAEDFENNWGFPQGSFELTAIDFAEFNSLEYEAFETGWGTIIYTFTSELEFAVFDTLDSEQFENAWRDNETSYAKTGTPMSTDFAEFYAYWSLLEYEGFEDTAFDRVCTADATNDTIELVRHGFGEGDIVFLEAEDGGEVPEPFTVDTPYYVANKTIDNFKLEAQVGDGAIDITTAGLGVIRVKADPDHFWTEELEI